MKKLLFGLFIFVSCFVLISFGVKTKAVSTPVMVNGASIRTTDKQGLKFSASVDSLEGITEKGFYIALGEHTKAAIETAVGEDSDRVGGKKLIKVVVEGEDLDFHAVIYNIPAEKYEQKITALAYVSNGTTNTYAEASVSRSIFQVATAAMGDDDYEPNEYIERIVCTSTFYLNGGSFAGTSSFTIGAYNDGSSGTMGITLCTKANRASGSGQYWYKVSLKQSSFNKHIFTIVEKVASGGSLNDSKDFDYVIAAHSSSDITTLTDAATKNYFYIPSFSAGATVKTNNNYELLLGTKAFFAPDEVLPSATKPYYDFAGWYNEIDFSGSVKTEKEGDIAEEFYAKWTPTEYTLSFDLQGGEASGNDSIDDVTFTVESSAYALPAAGDMSREDYTFVEWNTRSDGTGDPITSIPAGSHGNITVYAIWAYNAPVEVALSSADTAALAQVTPTKFVKSDFTAGRFSINGDVYETGTGAFATITAALAAASENDIIYVFAGTYASDITINTAGITIVGPNYNISGTASRALEASVNGSITVIANNVTLNGIKITGSTHTIYLGNKEGKIAVSNISILNVFSNATGKSTLGGRTAIIGSDYNVTNLVIRNTSINCTAATGRTAIALYGTVNGFTLKDSTISNTASSAVGGEVARINYIAGVFDIENNNFEWSSSSYSFYLGYSSNTCSSVKIVNNYIHGASSQKSTTIYVGRMGASKTLYFVGNHLKYVSGTILDFTNSSGSATINVAYNLFDTGVSFKTNTGSATVTYTSNMYEEAQTSTTSDVSAITSKADLITAYKGSAYYTTYGSICVYED